MPNQRRSDATSPPTAIMHAIKEMPWYQRFLVRTIGLAMLIGPAWVGMKLVPHLVHEDASWLLALILLVFLSLLMFIGLMITVPKIGVFLAGLLPIPESWKRLLERTEKHSEVKK